MHNSISRALEVAIKAKELIIALVFIFGWLAEPFMPEIVINYSSQELFADAPPNSDGETIFEIMVENESDESISDIELTVLGVSDIKSLSYKTSSKRLAEDFGNELEYQVTEKLLYISGFKNIPPGHNLKIQFLGNYSDPGWVSPIGFSSSAESKYIEARSYVTGAWVFAYEWSYIWIPLVLISLVLLTAYRIFPYFKKEAQR